MHQAGSETNVLPEILTQWFGPDAGRPGTNFQVVFEPIEDGYLMRPAENRLAASSAPEIWRTYGREEIPPLFGLTFSTAIWNAGFVPTGQQMFLLVTLEKGDLLDEHQYEDKFLSPDRFQWKSQNRTTQISKHGQMLRHHVSRNLSVQLFVRRSKKIGSVSAPFYYCGPVTFDQWQGERPITIDWLLATPVPEKLHSLFLIPGSKPRSA